MGGLGTGGQTNAALCAIRILRKCPELVDTYVERVGTLLGSRNHAVLLTSLKLMREMCLIEPSMVEQLRRHTSTLIAALKNLAWYDAMTHIALEV